MSSQAIDISSGLVPVPAQSQSIDLSAGLQPKGANSLYLLGPSAQPVQMSGTPALEQAYNDIKQGNYAKAAHGLISKAGAALAPLAAPFAAEAQFAYLESIIGGTAGQYATKKAATALGATPDQADVA